MRKINRAEFLDLYTNDLIHEVVTVGTTVVGKNYKGQADNPNGYEVVYCDVSKVTTNKASEVARKPVAYTKDKITSMVLKIVEWFTER